MCQRRSQRWPALLRIMSALAERLQIRRSRGPTATEADPGKERCTHIFEASSLQVVWPRCSQTDPRTLSKILHFEVHSQTHFLSTRNVRSRWYRGKHSNTLKPRRQTIRDNSGTKPSPRSRIVALPSDCVALPLRIVSIRIRSSADGNGNQIDSGGEQRSPTASIRSMIRYQVPFFLN